jgi:hypothetical protein
MSVAPAVLLGNVRAIPRIARVLLVVGVLMLVYAVTRPAGATLATLAFTAPVFFAAAVAYAAPADRRFVWGAVLIAALPAVIIVSAWLPDAWFVVAPGDWKNATPLLMDLGDPARLVARLLGFVGAGLLGLALGGVRTVVSVAIIGAGVLLGVVSAVRSLGNPIEGMPIDVIVQSASFPALYLVGWAFVLAAAVESRRALMATGTGLIFAILALNNLQYSWSGLQDPVPSNLLLATVLLEFIAWALVIAAALRGELDAAHSRATGDL